MNLNTSSLQQKTDGKSEHTYEMRRCDSAATSSALHHILQLHINSVSNLEQLISAVLYMKWLPMSCFLSF